MPHLPLLIAGLGNNAAAYQSTRHNIGFDVVEACAEEFAGIWGSSASFTLHKKLGAQLCETTLGPRRIVLVKPLGLMNECGPKIAAVTAYFSISLDRLLVVHDELDLNFGDFTCVDAGGDNGHKGLRSLSKQLGTKNYARLRIGIGRPPGRIPVSSYVLQRFSSRERSDIPLVRTQAVDHITQWIETRDGTPL